MRADIHSHILPGIDDGSPDLKTSRALLSALRSQNVTHLALTPHFYPFQKPVEQFLRERDRAFTELSSSEEAEGMTFSLGAEVYLTETLFNCENLTPLCYQNTRLMLTELEYTRRFTESSRLRLMRLIYDHSITPILAHIERFPFFADLGLLEELKYAGCLFQVNLTSFYSRGMKNHLCRLFETGFVDLIGEDVHHAVLCGRAREALIDKVEKKAPDLFRVADDNALSLIFSH